MSADEYIIDCLKQNKKPSGKKIGLLGGPVEDPANLFLKSLGQERPVCKNCGSFTSFIGYSKGFRRYCSTECYKLTMSARNSSTNKSKNKQRSIDLASKRSSQLERATEIYVSDNSLTVLDTSKQVGLPYNAVRQHLHINGYIDKARQKTVKQVNFTKNNQDMFSLLDDRDWVEQVISDGWSLRMIAKKRRWSS